MRSSVIYPAIPPAPAVPGLSQAVNGSLSGRTEYYRLTYVTAYGESFAGTEASITVAADSVTVIAPPSYPYPFPLYGYNVYGSVTTGAEVLQNGSTPVLAGETWQEPASGLITGTAVPPIAWTASTLTFGPYSYPTKVPAYIRESIRHKNVAASGVLETIFEYAEEFISFDLDFVSLGGDISNWESFVQFAEQGGIFSFYPDTTIGGGGSGFTNYTLDDDNWTAAYKAPQLYSFKMKWRQANGASGSGPIVPPSGGGGMFVGYVTPVDAGDHQNFTLATSPGAGSSLAVFVNGLLNISWTLAGTTITFSTPIIAPFNVQVLTW